MLATSVEVFASDTTSGLGSAPAQVNGEVRIQKGEEEVETVVRVMVDSRLGDQAVLSRFYRISRHVEAPITWRSPKMASNVVQRQLEIVTPC